MKAIPVILISGLLACLGLQPAWASADTAPALSSFSVTGSPATPGSTVALSYSVVVAAGSLKAMIFGYEDALGGTHEIRADGNVPLTGTINQIIPASWPNGTYALRFIRAVDPADNTARYMADGTIHNLPLASGPTSHTFNLNTADFTVTGSLADTIEPVLSSFSVAGMPAPGGSIGVSYSVIEAAGSLQAMIFEYEDALGGTHEILTDGDVPLTGTIIQIIPASWPNGTYALSVITAVDPTGNEASYMADGTISNWPAGASGRTSHAFDLSTADFTVAPVPLPDAPTDVSVVAGDGQVTVSWRAPAPGFGPPITSYGVYAFPNTMFLPSRNASSIGDRPTATITGLTNGMTYTIRVLASNGYGASPHSAPVTVTLMGPPPNLPNPPQLWPPRIPPRLPNPPTKAPPTQVQRYITHVYSDLFSRTPDPTGLATWTAKLNRGTPRVAVANAITYSTEYRSRLITGSYKKYLGRTPDSTGLTGWLGAMGRGWTISKMESGFIASGEYYAQAGSTDQGWVNKLYTDVLARGASPAEVAPWTAQLRAGKSRSTVAMGFLLSTERLSTVVDGHYRHLLGRGIDPSGLRTWVGILQHGGRDEAIIGGIIASAEYYGRS